MTKNSRNEADQIENSPVSGKRKGRRRGASPKKKQQQQRQHQSIIELIVDKSDENIGLGHLVAIYIWLGWFNVYVNMGIFLFAILVFPSLLEYQFVMIPATVVGGLLTVSALYPLTHKYQPSWSDKLGAWIME